MPVPLRQPRKGCKGVVGNDVSLAEQQWRDRQSEQSMLSKQGTKGRGAGSTVTAFVLCPARPAPIHKPGRRPCPALARFGVSGACSLR